MRQSIAICAWKPSHKFHSLCILLKRICDMIIPVNSTAKTTVRGDGDNEELEILVVGALSRGWNLRHHSGDRITKRPSLRANTHTHTLCVREQVQTSQEWMKHCCRIRFVARHSTPSTRSSRWSHVYSCLYSPSQRLAS